MRNPFEQLGFPWAPPGLGGPTGKPVRPNSLEGQLLNELKPGEEASIWRTGYPHQGHTDAELFRRFPDGKIYPVAKEHLNQK